MVGPRALDDGLDRLAPVSGGHARLAVGSAAPDFEATDWEGRTVRLADVPGKRWLAFFRYASCPLCNLQVRRIAARHPALSAAGLTVLAVFQSPAASLAQAVAREGPSFALLADPDERLYRLYGVETSLRGLLSPVNAIPLAGAMAVGLLPGRPEGSLTRIPADFLIDGAGTIRRAYYGRVISDHLPFAEVEAFLSG